MRPPTVARPSSRGFSLIELCVAVAIVGILAVAAIPSQLANLQRARRADAVAALTRMHLAQEQYRARLGSYSPELSTLTGASAGRSLEGWYLLAVKDAIGESVTLVASARPDGPQHSDSACREITLRLNQGLADNGPDSRCWNQ